MEEEYDYSRYTAVYTIKIWLARKTLMIHQFNNQRSSEKYKSEICLQIPLDFYYNKDSGNIIYGRQMIYPYKQYPPHEKYVHVSNFVEALYTLYQRSLKEKPTTQDDTQMCSAITSFLTKIYPPELSNKREASTTQYVFILPSHEHISKDFISTALRPLLQTTPWLTSDDLASKTVFYSEIDTYAYQLNDIGLHGFCLERERKYLLCNLQKTHDQNRLMLTVRFIRAVYDPDLIAASGRSMTALGENIMLSSKLLSPPLSLEIPIEPAIAIMDRLAMFLYNKVFAGEEDVSTLLEEYDTDSYHKSLIHHLAYAILPSEPRHGWSSKIDINDFKDSHYWSNVLNENMISRLSRITYGDIMQLFDDVDVPSIQGEFRHYLQKCGDEEIFQSIVMVEKDVYNAHKRINPSKSRNLIFGEEYYQRLYVFRVEEAIVCSLKKHKKCKNTKVVSIWPRDIIEGCAYKIFNMLELSNKLGRPVVMKPVDEIKQGSSKAAAVHKEKLALIEKIQPYGYYVEANISCSNKIKMSLNQVIETTTKDGRLQRSTMSILDSSYQAADMYNFIFDTIWRNIDGHSADPQCQSLQENELVDFDSYKIIRADLIDAVKNIMETKWNVNQDLDDVIYHYNTKLNCTCDITITHRLVVNIGVLPYLRCIADEMVASLKANAIFGNYKISCLLVTGDFLYKWLEQGNSTYGEFIWNQLKEAISSELAGRQLRVHLMMKKSIVREDSAFNYKPSKLEKYRQVLSKRYYLKITASEVRSFRVYHDRGDHCVEVGITKQQGDDLIAEVSLLAIKGEGGFKCLVEERFYLIADQKYLENYYIFDIELLALSPTDLENVDTALSSTRNIALRLEGLVPFSPTVKASMARCVSSVEVKITPCSYSSAIDLRLRLGIDDSIDDPLRYGHVTYSERLTLQRI